MRVVLLYNSSSTKADLAADTKLHSYVAYSFSGASGASGASVRQSQVLSLNATRYEL